MTPAQTYIDCPRARTEMTPCIARDGNLALSDPDPAPVCVGCGIQPRAALKELADRYPYARRYMQTHDPDRCADTFKAMVTKYVAEKQRGLHGEPAVGQVRVLITDSAQQVLDAGDSPPP